MYGHACADISVLPYMACFLLMKDLREDPVRERGYSSLFILKEEKKHEKKESICSNGCSAGYVHDTGSLRRKLIFHPFNGGRICCC